MFKKILFMFLLLISNGFASTEHCPTVNDLKHHHLANWKALHIDSASPLLTNEIDAFARKVAHFGLAEWMETAHEGAAHCYYQDAHKNKDYLGVFLAKENLQPDTGAWIVFNANVQQCFDDELQCGFASNDNEGELDEDEALAVKIP